MNFTERDRVLLKKMAFHGYESPIGGSDLTHDLTLQIPKHTARYFLTS